MSRNSFRLLMPLLLVSFLLMALCAFMALSLYGQQAARTHDLQNNVDSRRSAFNLEQGLKSLLAEERKPEGDVEGKRDRIEHFINALRPYVSEPEEQKLFPIIANNYAEYERRAHALPARSDPSFESRHAAVVQFLEQEVLLPCTSYRQFDAETIEASVAPLQEHVTQLTWGLAMVGALGGIAGLVLGYGVARGLMRSMHRLQVQLRDAAGKLEPGLTEIVVTREGGFPHLHAEIDNLTAGIEQMVRRLRQREHEVLRAEQLAAMGQLAAGVGHELRNPLTSIKLLVQSALEQPTSSLAPEDLRVIDREVLRMQQSLQRFLDFTRPPTMQRRSVPLRPLLDDIAELLHTRAEKQRVSFEWYVPSGLALYADGDQLRQVFVNLALNALDAMPDGGRLTIRARPFNAGHIRVEVVDTGPGLQPAILTRLFEPFASTKETGLGLGLANSKRIVEAHGGTIAAANSPEGGACFILTLPSETHYARGSDRR